MTFFLGFSAIKALHGNFWELYLSVFLSWTGYLTAHKSINGVWVDHGSEEDHNSNLIGTAAGIAMIVGSMVLGAFSVPENNLPLTLAASTLFVSGYLTSHYFSTEKLL